MILRRSVGIVISLLFSLVCFSGGNLLTERYNLAYLDLSNGLPHNNVSALYTDSNGFLWIGTYGGGLVRYDGYGMMHPVLGLRSLSCKSITEDRFKRLWIAFDEGTCVIDLKTMLPIVPKTPNGDLTALLSQPGVKVYTDALGRVWVVTTKEVSLLSFSEDGVVSSIYSYSYIGNTPDICLVDVDGNGKPWVGIDHGIYRMVEKNGSLVREEISLSLRALFNFYITDILKRGNMVWMTTNHGVFRFDPYQSKLDRYRYGEGEGMPSHEFLSSLALMPDNTLLVGSLYGVNIYDDVTNSFSAWNSASAIPLKNDFVHCLLVDKGLIYIGTEAGGVVRLSPRQLLLKNHVHTSDPGSLSPNPVNAMYAEPDGTLWVGTVEGGLNRKVVGDDSFIHFTVSNSGLSHNSVSALTADGQGRLWIGTWGGGICVLDMKAPQQISRLELTEEQRRLTNFVGALAYDSVNDGLWIGSNDGMFFYRFSTGRLEEPFDGCQEVRGCIGSIVTHDGHLWMGCIQGVRIVDLKSSKNGKFQSRAIIHLLSDPNSKIVDKISSFCEASDGTLWLGSNGYGLYRRLDGLVNPHFYWNSAIKDSAGRIYLGTEGGLIEITGENTDSHYQGHLVFTNLMVDNQDVLAGSDYLDVDISLAETITLKESNRSFSISFSALDFGHERQGLYSYRMKGFDKDWTLLKPGMHSVRYSALPTGHYTFEVKYQSLQTVGEDQVISIDVEVVPSFWNSWWFRSLLGFLFVGIVVYGYNRRVAELKRREAEQLMNPIRKALEESDDPHQLQGRIQNILDNQQRYKDSVSKSVEADQEEALKSTRPFMESVMQVMESHYMDSEFGVQEFCDALGMSRTVVSKRLNAEVGLPAGQFIRNYRLNMAKELLSAKTDNRNITEIAYAVGFNDPKYFTRCFTKMFGTSPSSWS